jgi:hypothetical protein
MPARAMMKVAEARRGRLAATTHQRRRVRRRSRSFLIRRPHSGQVRAGESAGLAPSIAYQQRGQRRRPRERSSQRPRAMRVRAQTTRRAAARSARGLVFI